MSEAKEIVDPMLLTGADFACIRRQLGLSEVRAAYLLGFPPRAIEKIRLIEAGEIAPAAVVCRLLVAYHDGYRPPDWDAEVSADEFPIHLAPRVGGYEFRDLREAWGLGRGQMAWMLGYSGIHAQDSLQGIELRRKEIRPATARLMAAYRDGYRPFDWGDNGFEESGP